jgi:hypothetical protein
VEIVRHRLVERLPRSALCAPLRKHTRAISRKVMLTTAATLRIALLRAERSSQIDLVTANRHSGSRRVSPAAMFGGLPTAPSQEKGPGVH